MKRFTTPPFPSTGGQPRSFRVEDDIWEAVKDRAQLAGISASRALQILAEGYARGMYVLPTVDVNWPDHVGEDDDLTN